jgi:hypothetical protein
VSRWHRIVPQVVVLLSALVAVPTCRTGTPGNTADFHPNRDHDVDAGIADSPTTTQNRSISDPALGDAAIDDRPMEEKVPPFPKLCDQPLNGDPNTGEVGYRKCPLCEPDKCPESCNPFHARPLDEKRGCWAEPIVVDCALKESVFAEAVGYYLDVSSGVVYKTPYLGLAPPRFRELVGDELGARFGITDSNQLPKVCDSKAKRR